MTGDSHIFFLGRTLIVLLILLCVTSLFSSSAAQDRPNLSEAIREVIDSQGVGAAKVHFTQMDPSERSQYSIDMEGISELTNSYLEDGNMDALIAISEISAPFMQDMASQAMEQYAPQMEKMEEMAGEREAEEEQAARQREQERVPRTPKKYR